jgi:heat shock protein HslJ
MGTGYCNRFVAHVMFAPPNIVIWPTTTYFTAVTCTEELEVRYFQALLTARRWRIEDGALILDNGTDTLRFLLAPA